MNERGAHSHFYPRMKARLRRVLGIALRAGAGCAARMRPRREPREWTPRRILVLNGAHIGDLVIATSLIPVLRSAYPEAQIGFAVGSWGAMVVRDHPDVAWVHEIDHWRMNRKAAGRLRKLTDYAKSRKRALREIRATGYDVSLSIYPVYPDFLDVAWQAGIPVRVGYGSSRLAPLATRLAEFPVSNAFLTQGARQAETLRALGIEEKDMEKRRPLLAPDSEAAVREVCGVLGAADLSAVRYRIIHMGSGAESRELPVEFWREIAAAAAAEGVVMFTGRGPREAKAVAKAMEGVPGPWIDACDRLSWKGFVAAVRHAEMLYGVESMAGHVAGAVGTPCRVVYGGASGVGRWRPEGASCMVFTEHVACAPCIHGCEGAECLRSVAAKQVAGTR